MIKKKYGQDATNVGDEGGFAPNIQVNHCFLKTLGIGLCCLRLFNFYVSGLFTSFFCLTSGKQGRS